MTGSGGGPAHDPAGAGRVLLPARSAGRVRPFRAGDLDAVVGLYGRVFPARPGRAPGDVRAHLDAVFCRHPWRGTGPESLVFEDRDGVVAGCLGVMPRPMILDGRPIRAAITHTFMVEPGSRAALAGVALARAFLDGEQDLAIAEGGDSSRRILERAGGVTVLLYSLRWTRPLRPGRHALALLRRRGLPAAAARLLLPLGAAGDLLAPLIPERALRRATPRLEGEPLDSGAHLEALQTLTRDAALRPEHGRESLDWLLRLLAGKPHLGTLRARLVRDAAGEIAGWYVAFSKRGGISEVVQLGARKDVMPDLIDRLFDDARRGGAVAVSGQFDPAAFQALSERGCVFHHDGGSWFLAHARSPEPLQALHAGRAFLTRLEGEWCVAL